MVYNNTSSTGNKFALNLSNNIVAKIHSSGVGLNDRGCIRGICIEKLVQEIKSLSSGFRGGNNGENSYGGVVN